MDNLAGLVRRAGERRPDAPALLGGATGPTWAALAADVRAVAGGLARLGAAPGDRLALCAGNGVDAVVAYWAALHAGLTVVPLLAAGAAQPVAAALDDLRVKLLVADPATARAVAGSGPPGLRTVVVGPGERAAGTVAFAQLSAGPPAGPEPRGGGEDLALLAPATAPDGSARTAMLPHRALLANLAQLAALDPPPLRPDDVVLLALPLARLYSLNAVLGPAADVAAAVVLADPLDPAGTLELMARHRVTVAAGVPATFRGWLEHPDRAGALAGLRLAVCAGAPLERRLQASFEAATGRPLHQGYGMVEAAPVVTSTLAGGPLKPGSVGRPLPGVQLRLTGPGGEPADPDDPAEIAVRGPNLFTGYWPDRRDGPDADGWFRTGDVGYLDADGDLVLVDRRGEAIVVSGFPVHPREVEAVLTAHPDVAEAAVVGVPDPGTGAALRALVRLRPDARLTGPQLLEHAAARLARFKRPAEVVFVAELPHSAAGGLDRDRLRRAAGRP